MSGLRFPVSRLALALVLCSGVTIAGITLVSVEEEIEIGRAAAAQMRTKVPELRDSETSGYVRSIGQRLIAHAPGAKYPYRFTTANLPEINAFSLPGGPIWINRGVLQKAAEESQVAAVLAHEVAHVALRHGADRLTQGMVARWGLGLLGALLGNSVGAGTAQAAAGVLASGVMLTFSRDEERAADLTGLAILTKAGWAGRGMVDLFELLRREAGRDPTSVEAFLSSHPSPQDRIDNLSSHAKRSQQGRRDSRQFREIKQRLARMPAARPASDR